MTEHHLDGSAARARRLRWSSVLTAVAAALALSAPASASNWGSTGSQGTGVCNGEPCVAGIWLTPGRTWVVSKQGLAGAYSSAVDSVVPNEYGPTVLATSVISNGDGCQPSTRGDDTCVYDGYYLNPDFGILAWNACPTSAPVFTGSHPDQRCQHQIVRLELAHYGYVTSFTNGARHMICHELGHSVGLRHSFEAPVSSCMNQFWEDSAVGTNIADELTAHDRAHVNAHY